MGSKKTDGFVERGDLVSTKTQGTTKQGTTK
jgi:hypothetical protein